METECKTYLSQDRILVTQEFISYNNLRLKSEKEILEKLNSEQEKSFFNFTTEVLSGFLPFDLVKHVFTEKYVKEIESGVKEWACVNTIEECAQDFLDYMNFAWGKAEDERGLSASRSINKLSVWLWVMNREDLSELINDDELYNPYGAPALIAVCEKMNIQVPQSLIDFSKIKN